MKMRNLNPDIDRIKEVSYRYIKFRFRSEYELKVHLRKKGYIDCDIDNCISQLKEEGFLDDKRFAKFYAYDSLTIKFKGPLKIKNELENFGIEGYIIEDTIDELMKEIDIKEVVREYLEKKYRNIDLNKIEKYKIVGNLYRRGFVIYDVEGVLNDYIDYRKED